MLLGATPVFSNRFEHEITPSALMKYLSSEVKLFLALSRSGYLIHYQQYFLYFSYHLTYAMHAPFAQMNKAYSK